MNVGIILAVLKILGPVALELSKSKSKKSRDLVEKIAVAMRILKDYAKIDSTADIVNPGDLLRGNTDTSKSNKSKKSGKY